MVSTPKSSNTSNDSSKINIMSSYEDFSQYIDPASTESPQLKSEVYGSPWFDIMSGNDLLAASDLDLFQADSIYDISPILTSSMTTPSLVIEGDINDSPIYNTSSSFVASPSLDPPPLGFFPELPSDASFSAATRRSLAQLAIAPSVTIPVDDPTSLTAIPGSSNLSSALNIPWSTETTSSSSTDLLQNASSSSPLMTSYSGNNTENNSPKSSSTGLSSPSTPIINKLNSRNRKRTNVDVEKDPQTVADEAAAKRAKNTDAARRSRERKVEKMKELERQVALLKTENNELQTKIAVLESEKRGLEDMNSEKDTRIKTLEQRFEALISSRK